MKGRRVHADAGVSIWHGTALDLPLADASVDLVVTSPPYYGLRSYTDDGAHYAEQVGGEPTPREYVDTLLEATAEMVRVLKPAGSIWVNLGDKFSRPGGGGDRANRSLDGAGRGATMRRPTSSRSVGEIPEKSLMGLPWRYALRVMDDLGLILRRDQIWSKTNGMPESVTDRTRSTHEYLFHFVKRPDYFSAIDEIREPHARAWVGGVNGGRGGWDRGDHLNAGLADAVPHALGALPGSVWEIATQPLHTPWGYGVEAGRIARYFTDERVAVGWLRLGNGARRRRIRQLPDHFAAFPIELPRRIIRGWSPAGICTACGEGRRPVAEKSLVPDAQGRVGTLHSGVSRKRAHATARKMLDGLALRTIAGYECACPSPAAATRPAVVLDPFGGTCTTALVARAEGRSGVAVDLSADYCRLGRWRVTDPGELARALEVRKPPPVPLDTDALFDLGGSVAPA